jgi:hypothetical protein
MFFPALFISCANVFPMLFLCFCFAFPILVLCSSCATPHFANAHAARDGPRALLWPSSCHASSQQ